MTEAIRDRVGRTPGPGMPGLGRRAIPEACVVVRGRRFWLLAPIALLPSFAASGNPVPKRGQRAERQWMERSAALVEAARQHAGVGDFRRDILAHRERLREIVRAGKNAPAPELELHRNMILMNALLNAASECHSGGRLACPPDLMRQMEAQLTTGFAQLRVIEKGGL